MTQPASRQTKLHAERAIKRHKQQQEAKAIAEMATSTPNRAQRRARKNGG